jgi:hypothetical protein
MSMHQMHTYLYLLIYFVQLMASVNSPIRILLKPLLFKLFGKNFYAKFQFYTKIKDIDNKLVEEKEMELLPYFLKKDSNSIDIGANYAYYTISMAQQSKKVLPTNRFLLLTKCVICL